MEKSNKLSVNAGLDTRLQSIISLSTSKRIFEARLKKTKSRKEKRLIKEIIISLDGILKEFREDK